MAWLTGWSYRKSHTISGSTAGAQTDYCMRIDVHRDTGSDSGQEVYVGTNCESDYGDIRFTTSDGTTLLDFWLQEYAGTEAIFWVEIDSIPASPSTVDIYVYYGKSGQATTSNGDNTFQFYDHLDNYSINDTPNATDWDTDGIDANNHVKVQQDPADASKKVFKLTESGDSTVTYLLAKLADKLPGLAYYWRLYHDTNCRYYYESYDDATQNANYRTDPQNLEYRGWANVSPTKTINMDTWYEIIWEEIKNDFNRWIVDGTTHTGGWYSQPTTGINKIRKHPIATSASILYLGGIGSGSGGIFCRKLANPEPTHSTWGSEETPPVAGITRSLRRRYRPSFRPRITKRR